MVNTTGRSGKMMRRRGKRGLLGLLVAGAGIVGPASPVRGQDYPWWQLQDPESGITCSLVHAANVDFVIIQGGGEIMLASPPNTILPDLVVDDLFNVYFDGEFYGSIAFDEDADGDRALFWLSLTGKVVGIGEFDASPTTSDLFPSDIGRTGCDACARYPSLPGCGSDSADDDSGDVVGSFLSGLCGAGGGAAMVLTTGLLMVGKRRRASRRGRPVG